MEEYLLAQKGNVDMLNELVRRHMPLVQMLSRRFSWQEDAFQAGCIGLVKAIRRFDVHRGVKFSTYAVPFILGEMRRAAAGQMHWRSQAMLKSIRQEQEKFMQSHMREPTVGELAELTGCPGEELMLLLERSRPVQHDPDGLLIASAPDPKGEGWMEQWMLRDMIERLPADERRLLHLRYVEERNQKEVAQLMATSQSRVSRIENRVCGALRAAWTENG